MKLNSKISKVHNGVIDVKQMHNHNNSKSWMTVPNIATFYIRLDMQAHSWLDIGINMIDEVIVVLLYKQFS